MHRETAKGFSLNTPWWQTGYDPVYFVAAVSASTEERAIAFVEASYDHPSRHNTASVSAKELPLDWTLNKLSDRFPVSDWHRSVWPTP